MSHVLWDGNGNGSLHSGFESGTAFSPKRTINDAYALWLQRARGSRKERHKGLQTHRWMNAANISEWSNQVFGIASLETTMWCLVPAGLSSLAPWTRLEGARLINTSRVVQYSS